MDKDAIIKTAVTSFSQIDKGYITESPLAETIVGAGETEQESYQVFLEMVELNYEAYKMGKHALYKNPDYQS